MKSWHRMIAILLFIFVISFGDGSSNSDSVDAADSNNDTYAADNNTPNIVSFDFSLNEYISGDTYLLADRASESNCQYFLRDGTICGADVSLDCIRIQRGYYQESIGSAGYHYHSSATCSGTSDSYHSTNTFNIDQITSSLHGDIVNYTQVTAPNNTPKTASVISHSLLPVTMRSDFNAQDDDVVMKPANHVTNYYRYLNESNENEPNLNLSESGAILLNTAMRRNFSLLAEDNSGGKHDSITM